ncbi:MAG: hypothetical protein Q7T96_10630 [Methylobacter sp.]|nr:hypothetical protein [Methylobacter sp.]
MPKRQETLCSGNLQFTFPLRLTYLCRFAALLLDCGDPRLLFDGICMIAAQQSGKIFQTIIIDLSMPETGGLKMIRRLMMLSVAA